jgi:kynureninase
VGALPSEVTVMNTLTVNLHLLMVLFYQPTKLDIKLFARRKHFLRINTCFRVKSIFIREALAFIPRMRLSKLSGAKAQHRLEDVLAKIKEVGNELALVLIGGVNYYTGQVLI